jgi:hypothetical protein
MPRAQLGVLWLDQMGNMSHSHGVVWLPHVDGRAGPSSVQFLGRPQIPIPTEKVLFVSILPEASHLHVAYTVVTMRWVSTVSYQLSRRKSIHYCIHVRVSASRFIPLTIYPK